MVEDGSNPHPSPGLTGALTQVKPEWNFRGKWLVDAVGKRMPTRTDRVFQDIDEILRDVDVFSACASAFSREPQNLANPDSHPERTNIERASDHEIG